ncbi:MAG: integration host factor subunit beta [Alphaproteobacteria bacterium CG11_big_fil_rev_8_21_14_0_20_44_7]|nr:MAG: integration host factor subunit beta [Alphaproteobacteria bacterium CG11_big_fil_rev_8_21_14_0_20_44_7]
MTKSELIKNLSVKFPSLREKEIEDIVNLILKEISDTLVAGDRVELRGFGAFSIRKREARVARNPRTGEKVKVAARKSIYYRPGKELKETLNS